MSCAPEDRRERKELSVSGTPRKTADNPGTVGFCLKKASFISGYVGNLTDNPCGACRTGFQQLEASAMAQYDPETLTLLRNVLDQAWALLPDDRKSESQKSDMALRILKKAAEGVRDPVRLRTSALVGSISGVQ
jgi:hypothetical protein